MQVLVGLIEQLIDQLVTTCNACIPVRINVQNINQIESMKRAKKGSDLECLERPPIATREQYELFYEYQKYRHFDSDMSEMNFSEYRSMVEDTPVETYLYEFRDNDNYLVAASLTDKVEDGLSGIYKFFIQ